MPNAVCLYGDRLERLLSRVKKWNKNGESYHECVRVIGEQEQSIDLEVREMIDNQQKRIALIFLGATAALGSKLISFFFSSV